jgi:thioredoxin reductase (NADPH)
LFYDAILIGAGSAGLTTGIYLGRDGYEVLVVEKTGLGGRSASLRRWINFPALTKA